MSLLASTPAPDGIAVVDSAVGATVGGTVADHQGGCANAVVVEDEVIGGVGRDCVDDATVESCCGLDAVDVVLDDDATYVVSVRRVGCDVVGARVVGCRVGVGDVGTWVVGATDVGVFVVGAGDVGRSVG